MTYGEFLAALSEASKVRPFEVHFEHIRTKEGCMCPIVAVGKHKGIGGLGSGSYSKVANALGLSNDVRNIIVVAADYGHSDLNDKAGAVRIDLLNACGLSSGEVPHLEE